QSQGLSHLREWLRASRQVSKESQFQRDVECARRHKAQAEGMQSLGRIRRRLGQTRPPCGHDASGIVSAVRNQKECSKAAPPYRENGLYDISLQVQGAESTACSRKI